MQYCFMCALYGVGLCHDDTEEETLLFGARPELGSSLAPHGKHVETTAAAVSWRVVTSRWGGREVLPDARRAMRVAKI